MYFCLHTCVGMCVCVCILVSSPLHVNFSLLLNPTTLFCAIILTWIFLFYFSDDLQKKCGKFLWQPFYQNNPLNDSFLNAFNIPFLFICVAVLIPFSQMLILPCQLFFHKITHINFSLFLFPYPYILPNPLSFFISHNSSLYTLSSIIQTVVSYIINLG